MKDFFKKIFSKINLGSKKTKIILAVALILIALFFVGKYFYAKYHVSDYSEITILVNNKEYVKAEDKLQNLLKEDASDPYFLVLVARTYIGRSGQVTDPNTKNDYLVRAIQVLNTAESLNPSIMEIYRTKAIAYQSLGQFNFAEDFYKKALALNPNSFDIMIDLGNLALATGNINEAIIEFSNVLKSDKTNVQANIGLIKVFMNQNRFDHALSSALNVFNSTNDSQAKGQIAELLGQIYSKLTKYDDARTYYQIALKYNPSSIYANYGLAEVEFVKSYNINAKYSEESLQSTKKLLNNVIKIDPFYPYSYILFVRIDVLTQNKTAYATDLALATEKIKAYNYLSATQKNNLIKSLPTLELKQDASVFIRVATSTMTTKPHAIGIGPKK